MATYSDNQNYGDSHTRLRNNLSRYIGRIEAGEPVVVTAHGRVVAELVAPAADSRGQTSQFDRLVASGAITPPVESGDPLNPEIRLPQGTATSLIDIVRGEP